MGKQKIMLLYNGSYCGEKLFNKIFKNQNISMSYAQEKLEKMLFKGFNLNDYVEVTAISAVPVRAYPGNKKIWWTFKKNFIYNDVLLAQLPFINILGIKQIIFMFGSFMETFKWCYKNRKNKNKAMLSYSANPPVILPMLFICKMWGVKNVIIVTEIPKFRFFEGQSTLLRVLLLKIMLTISTWLHECFDGYILLTEHMNSQLNYKKNPYIIIEGMVDIGDLVKSLKESCLEKRKKIILYSGTLNSEYGLPTLIEGFKMLNMPNVELWFCGQGNYQNEIKLVSKTFQQIRYFGMLSHNEVSQLQIQADFLINPRPTNSEYTSYSFPSKTLEYMLTETPVISTKLNGIPDEYDNYLIYIEDETAEGYYKQLKNILEDDYTKYKITAKKGRDFVIKKKNLKIQTKKVLDFIEELVYDKNFKTI